jgi:hypothetical protein
MQYHIINDTVAVPLNMEGVQIILHSAKHLHPNNQQLDDGKGATGTPLPNYSKLIEFL